MGDQEVTPLIRKPVGAPKAYAPRYGTVYILYDKLRKHVKIGRTIVSEKERCREIRRNHGRPDTILVYECQPLKFHLLQRLEYLVLKDLRSYQRPYDCYNCGDPTRHGEWFDVSIGVAERTIRMWHKWLIGMQPYQPYQFPGPAGELKKCWTRRLEDLVDPQPCPEDLGARYALWKTLTEDQKETLHPKEFPTKKPLTKLQSPPPRPVDRNFTVDFATATTHISTENTRCRLAVTLGLHHQGWHDLLYPPHSNLKCPFCKPMLQF